MKFHLIPNDCIQVNIQFLITNINMKLLFTGDLQFSRDYWSTTKQYPD